MLVLGIVGALAFYAGYALPVGRRIARAGWNPRTGISGRTLETGAVAFGALGVLLFFLFLHSTGGAVGVLTLLHGRSSTLYAYVSGSTAYFWLGPYLLIPAAFVLIVYGRAAGERTVWVLGVAFAAILTIRGYALGDRLILTPFWGGIVVYYFVSRGKRPSVVGLLATLIGALLLITLIGSFRNASVRATTSAGSTFVAIVTHPTTLLDTLTSSHDSGEAAALAAALTVVPSHISYQHGAATVGDLIQRPVPRTLWPNKPLKPKFQIVQLLWPREYAAHISNPEFSCLLVFYMDFGVFGVVLGMIAYGIVARIVWAYFLLHSEQMFAQVMLALMVPFVVMEIRDSFTDSFIRAMLIFFPVWVIFYLSQRGSPRRARRSGIGVRGRPAETVDIM
jgi:hypothetical protein